MVDVVEEPNIRLVEVLLERHSVAIGHLELALVSILSKEGSNDTLFGVFGHSVVVVDD